MQEFDPLRRPKVLGRKAYLIVTAISCLIAIGVLAFVMTVGVYALNVGTIWSEAAPKPPAPRTEEPAVRAGRIAVRNTAAVPVEIYLRDREGLDTRIGVVRAGSASRIPFSGPSGCAPGFFIAIGPRGEVDRTADALCDGAAWTIRPR